MFWSRKPLDLPTPEEALPGRATPLPLQERHSVNGTPLAGPYPEGLEVLDLGMGCFWGAERIFWQTPGVVTTLVGYEGGITPNPTYEETCTGLTGHVEVVRVVYDPKAVSLEQLLTLFWENHDPTQGMRQGNDVGTTYRSAVYTHTDEQLRVAKASREVYEQALVAAGRGTITTEILPATTFYNAEGYHQQYLHKNPGGYCNHGFNGVSCQIGTGVLAPPMEQQVREQQEAAQQ
ncbi:MAG: peptide-methionine (S)-S-oxide reductase [Frankiales bacterium]|nr:peptide-methionine (S)-S-oxide reductase [Frankiales bacterium]